MATKKKREYSKDAESLRKKVLSVRKEIIDTLHRKIKSVKCRYLEQNGGIDYPEGYISLNNGVVHYSHDSDGNLNEVIVGIHTDRDLIQTDCSGEVTDGIMFNDVHDLNLISIISELDHQNKHPEIVDIVTGEEY